MKVGGRWEEEEINEESECLFLRKVLLCLEAKTKKRRVINASSSLSSLECMHNAGGLPSANKNTAQ